MMGARFDIAIDQVKESAGEIYAKLQGRKPDPPVIAAAKAVTSSIASAASSIKKEL
jgi:hypothetical protein